MLEIRTIVVTPFQQNARLLIDEETRDCVVVDPGGEVPLIVRAIEEEEVRVSHIVLTHAHIDHGGGVAKLLEFCCKENDWETLFVAHAEEQEMRSFLTHQAVMFGLPSSEYQAVEEPEILVDEEMNLEFGKSRARILHVPGHSPGHIALFFAPKKLANHSSDESEPLLISGDVLFAGSIGRTDLPGGDHSTLISSIKNKIFSLPERTRVLSGHGPDTTVGEEKRCNPFLQ